MYILDIRIHDGTPIIQRAAHDLGDAIRPDTRDIWLAAFLESKARPKNPPHPPVRSTGARCWSDNVHTYMMEPCKRRNPDTAGETLMNKGLTNYLI